MISVFENLFPVVALIFAGQVLRRREFTTGAFLKVSDRLVYFIFFPVMLFWKIGGAPLAFTGEGGFYASAVLAVAVVFLLSTAYILFAGVARYQAGSFSQSCYRFNTFIGVAVVMSAFGEEGVRRFGLLIGVVIPLINVLSVATLNWFGGRKVSPTVQLLHTVRALAANPLVLGCLVGMVYARFVHWFPAFLDNTLRMASYVTLPLALISIGGALSLEGMRTHLRLSLTASIFKLAILPVIGFASMKAMGVTGQPFQVGMVFFALPTSTALYILSSQLNSDTDLAAAAIALSTLLSIFSLSAALLM
jgi:malonate transporter and related proteins